VGPVPIGFTQLPISLIGFEGQRTFGLWFYLEAHKLCLISDLS